MQQVDYVGRADVRVITDTQLGLAGFGSPTLIWNKANNFELIVDDAIAAYLLAADQDFRVSSPATQFFSTLVTGGDSNTYQNPSFGDWWRTAKTLSGTRPVNAVALSDSIGVGEGSTDWWALGSMGLVRTAMQGILGNGGSGWIGPAYRGASGSKIVTTTGAWTDVPGGGIARVALQPTASSSNATVTFPFEGTNLDMWFQTDPTFGTFHYQIDGGSFIAVNLNIAAQMLRVPVTGLAAGAHSVTIRTTTGTGKVWGVRGFNATGFVLDNFSNTQTSLIDLGGATPGLTTTDPADNTMALRSMAAVNRPIDLIILMLGANDVGVNQNDGTAIPAIWNSLSLINWGAQKFGPASPSLNGRAEVLVVAENIGNFDNFLGPGFSAWDLDWLQTYNLQRQAAEAMGAGFCDMWGEGRRAWKYWQSLNNWAAGNTDAIHPANGGHSIYGTKITGMLTG